MKKTGKFLYCISLFFVLLLVVEANQIVLHYPDIAMSVKFNGWNDEKYDGWVCKDKTPECERFLEGELGIPCYYAYGIKYQENGGRAAHMWLIMDYKGELIEYECTSLKRKKVSDTFELINIQLGFFVDGKEYKIAQNFEDQEEMKEMMDRLLEK